MKVISVNVGDSREVVWEGRPITTGIFKNPVAGPVAVRRHQLAGDRQADLRVHGGEHKAVYAYPMEHYRYWGEALAGVALPWGSFGENLTTEGLAEPDLHLGDRLRIGTVELRITQPRIPCMKLNARFQRPEMVKDFLASRRSGFYCAVVAEGEVEAGDSITVLGREAGALTVRQLVDLYAGEHGDPDLLERALALPVLSEKWRTEFRRRLDAEEGRS